MRFYPSAVHEEKLIYWAFFGTVVFFILAATTFAPDERNVRSRRKDGTKRRGNRSPSEITPAMLRQRQVRADALFEAIYRATFQPLKEEHRQFLEPPDAKAMIHADSDAVRKPRCGGWVSTIPALALKYMGVRCPPLELI